MDRLKVLSLFSGCGGFDLGVQGGFEFLGQKYKRNPFEIVFANDIHAPTCDTYDKNFKRPIHRQDVVDLLSNSSSKLPDCDVLIGGFPCQDFSLSGKRKLFKTTRGRLYKEMIRAIDKKTPAAFIAENVYGLVLLGALDKIKSEFTKAGKGYTVSHHIVMAADYGVPQLRKRVFLVGIRNDIKEKFDTPIATHAQKPIKNREEWITAKQALGGIVGKETTMPNHNEYSKAKFYKKRWQGTVIIKSDEPAPTIRAYHHGNIQFHYKGHRRLTVRECARLQTFPDNFIFTSSPAQNYISVGNAVPPILAWRLAHSLVATLKNGGVM